VSAKQTGCLGRLAHPKKRKYLWVSSTFFFGQGKRTAVSALCSRRLHGYPTDLVCGSPYTIK